MPVNLRERTIPILPERVRGGGVRVRPHISTNDGDYESLFFLLALIAGAVCGYLVAIA
jgi:hypothetical protein